MNFNPRCPCGQRLYITHRYAAEVVFQSTLPIRAATEGGRMPEKKSTDFNPRCPYGQRPERHRMGKIPRYFNPRCPYGQRQLVVHFIKMMYLFQSTLPIRAATNIYGRTNKLCRYFNPRCPYGQRLFCKCRRLISIISIHAAHTGSD